MQTLINAATLAQAINAQLEGAADTIIKRPATLKQAGEGDISFLANPKYRSQLIATQASVLIVPLDISLSDAPQVKALLKTDQPDAAFSQAVDLLLPVPASPAPGIHPTAVIHESAEISITATIGALVFIDAEVIVKDHTIINSHVSIGRGAKIGQNCLIHAGAIVANDVVIGDNVILQANAIVGSDGFGYTWSGEHFVKIRQAGGVVLADNVELGACATVDRARFDQTRIGAGTKIDNLCHIAHNVQIGQNSAFAAQTGISGSTTVGNNVQLGGQVGLSGHIDVGDGVVVYAQSGLSKDVPAGQTVFGSPAIPLAEWMKVNHALKQVPKLLQRIKELEAEVTNLKNSLDK